ncbi:MAG: FKBP-type peptidyl-prolyl cis-trans isomerase [Candidatus Limimorpha sp.]
MLVFLLPLTSCVDSQTDTDVTVIDANSRRESVEKANRYMVRQENELINDYIARHNWDMVETGTGLRYRIVKHGDTALIKRKDIVSMEYEVRLLNGELVYSSNELGAKVIVVGRGGIESGLEEAMLHLHRGDVADIILPSHLAHGLLGDGDKIPPKAALVYSVRIK